MPKTSQSTRYARATSAIAGITKHLPARAVVYADGKPYSSKQVIAFFQAQIDAVDAIRRARAQLAVAVTKEREAARLLRPIVVGLQFHVVNRFGPRPDILGDFGMQRHKKPGPKTTAAKLSGVLKAAATRKARNTMGPKQRLKIRGTLPTT